ncbi:NCS1 family nucleobase:cation symporter-1 [Nocardiopsis lambiniae]|uniref:NCS1 family nucleobase:cation symporter-1 n=1 Tax=Nocardiopsis lambiniae TaxID=3075539 RepID=A0ABU2MDQ1_9ACTN|nr:NCS1 family nucleobase:cation symporter-1 [Nocardiopsis sp. DSM 44743]MDT0330799.1 NCS1 family nucleobase:cation symporter-1 [Nocardiopsis sp. DSM 44743]
MTQAPPTPEPSAVTHPDGRVSLAEGASMPESPYVNEDLQPVPMSRRTWGTGSFTALWVSMSVSIPAWTLASGLIAAGMDWRQAILCVVLGNVIVLAPMVLTGHAGAKYGIPFPVFARASFGLRGANLPALLRGAVACGWFGIQTWVGGQGVYVLAGRMFGEGWLGAAEVGGNPWTLWLSFAVFWVVQVLIILWGMEGVRKVQVWAAPLMIVGGAALLVWMAVEAGGVGVMLAAAPEGLDWSPSFWALFFPSLMGVIGFWSTLTLNISDFTRFSSSQRAQTVGQSLGLPTTMTLFSLLAVMVTAGTAAVYDEPLWNPIDIVAQMGSGLGLLFAIFVVLLATISTNVAANLVGPAYDLANLAPRLIDFRTGAIITCFLGVLIFPWKLLENESVYIFTWLGTVGGVLGTVAGILLADYWVVRRTRLDLPGLYRRGSEYWYGGGWNWRALVAFGTGTLLAVGGSHSGVDAATGAKLGPFPEDGLIPPLAPLADYGWVVGLVSAFVLYWVLNLVAPVRVPATGDAGAAPDAGEPEQRGPEKTDA